MKVIIEQPKIPVMLSPDEARLFVEFQKRYLVIAPIMGYMDSMKLDDLKETHIELDLNSGGVVSHMAITKHYRI